jgi:hypothetical protein
VPAVGPFGGTTQVGAVVEDRAAGGNADRAAQITHEVEEAGCQFQSFGRQSA